MPSAKAVNQSNLEQSKDIVSHSIDDSTNFKCFNDTELDALAVVLENCQITELNLGTCQKGLKDCSNAMDSTTAFWQKPGFVIGGITVSLALGGILGILLSRR